MKRGRRFSRCFGYRNHVGRIRNRHCRLYRHGHVRRRCGMCGDYKIAICGADVVVLHSLCARGHLRWKMTNICDNKHIP